MNPDRQTRHRRLNDTSMSEAVARAPKIRRTPHVALALALNLAMWTMPAAYAAPAIVHDMVTFTNSPFPFEGTVPEQDLPFLQQDPDGRQFHLSPRGGKLYADLTYSDRRSLLFIPPSFDPAKPNAALVLFFHGNLATLSAVETQQKLSRQLAASRINAVLVAPQMAVKALDSSAGRFYEPDFFPTYLHEAAVHLAELSGGRFDAAAIDRLPVVIVAFSGGYLPTAFTLHYAQEQSGTRIAGVILLDAMFGETKKFEDWIVRERDRTFFVSAYSKASMPLNEEVAAALRGQGVPVQAALTGRLGLGDVIFQAVPGVTHDDFVTQAWTASPLADVLARVRLAEHAGAAR